MKNPKCKYVVFLQTSRALKGDGVVLYEFYCDSLEGAYLLVESINKNLQDCQEIGISTCWAVDRATCETVVVASI